MKISELIKQLENAYSEHGDQDVWIYTDTWDAFVDPESVEPARGGKPATVIMSS